MGWQAEYRTKEISAASSVLASQFILAYVYHFVNKKMRSVPNAVRSFEYVPPNAPSKRFSSFLLDSQAVEHVV